MSRSTAIPRYPICSFTTTGLNEFAAWLDRAEVADPKRYTSEPPPEHLLFDNQYSVQVGYGNPVRQRKFERKYDVGLEVCSAAGEENMRQLLADANAWAWLTLYFHDSTIPFSKGMWWTGVRSRHIVDKISGRSQDQGHRHLVKGASTNVYRFKEFATVLMSGPSEMSKIEEQIMSRKVDPPLAFLPELVKAIHKLYWDVDADDVKRGASGVGNGSIMHIVDLLGQFDLTFDVSHLQSERLIALLPKAFSQYQKNDRLKRARRKGGMATTPSEAAVP